MPWCTVCNREVSENESSFVSAALFRRAVEAGLLPPRERSERQSRMLGKAPNVGIPEIERQWRESLLDDQSGANQYPVCGEHKAEVQKRLNVGPL